MPGSNSSGSFAFASTSWRVLAVGPTSLISARKLGEVQVIVRAKAGSAGKLFGAVTSDAISKALKEQFDIDIEKNKIVQAEPIKTFGSYTVKAKLGYEVSGNINVLVVEEK